MKEWLYQIGDWFVINEGVKEDSPSDIGKLAYIKDYLTGVTYDYRVAVNDSELNVRESELNSIPKNKLDYYLKINNWKKVVPKQGTVREIINFDFLNEKLYVKDGDLRYYHSFDEIKEYKGDEEMKNKVEYQTDGYFETKGKSLGELIDKKQEAYGDSVGKTGKLIRIFLSDYLQEDGTYKISEELLDNILLQVRIIDKQNRIFSNPKADKMDESPYTDISGYGLLGERMQGLKK